MRERTRRFSRLLLGALFALGSVTAFATTQAGAADNEPAGMVAARAQFDVLARDQGATQVNAQLVSTFSALAGSSNNAQGLVSGLRTGQQITLTSTAPDGSAIYTTINPPTAGMSWGDVYVALALAQASLDQQGIASPTAAQLGDALTGILTQRTGGAGWGRIAQSLGVKLGPIVSTLRSASAQLGAEQGDPAPAPEQTRAQSQPPSARPMAPGDATGYAMGGAGQHPGMPTRPELPVH